MLIPRLVNIIAGAYKGYMNAEGQDVDSTYLAYVLASTSVAKGISAFISTQEKQTNPNYSLARALTQNSVNGGIEERSPAFEGVGIAIAGVPVGALEISLGYGLGYVANKIIK